MLDLVVNHHRQLRCGGSTPAESPRIPLLPKHPPDEEEEGVEASPDRLWYPLSTVQPPLHDRLFFYVNDGLEVQLADPDMPDLPVEAAAQ